ncbi:MAG: aldo/keto reductase, partial [Candidatus Glassbacteria bacterium]
MKMLSRREFIRTAAAAAALPAVGASLVRAAQDVTINGLPASVLGRTGLKVTRISLGGVLVTEPSLLVKVIDQGINFIHTAPGYTNGRSLEAFGKAFRDKGLRQKVVLAIKERPEAIDSCLKTLGTDYIDILVPPLTSL